MSLDGRISNKRVLPTSLKSYLSKNHKELHCALYGKMPPPSGLAKAMTAEYFCVVRNTFCWRDRGT